MSRRTPSATPPPPSLPMTGMVLRLGLRDCLQDGLPGLPMLSPTLMLCGKCEPVTFSVGHLGRLSESSLVGGLGVGVVGGKCSQTSHLGSSQNHPAPWTVLPPGSAQNNPGPWTVLPPGVVSEQPRTLDGPPSGGRLRTTQDPGRSSFRGSAQNNPGPWTVLPPGVVSEQPRTLDGPRSGGRLRTTPDPGRSAY